MKDNRKLLQKIFLILLGCALLAGVSYAFVYFSFLGSETNVINAGCLKLDLVEGENLSLTNAITLTDAQGIELDPYAYTITNTCTTEAYYETTFNILNTSGVGNEGKTKIYLTGDTYVSPTMLSNLSIVNLTDKPSDVRTSYAIDTGYLKPNESKTFYLNMWIDYDVTEYIGSMDGRIIIDAVAKKGPSFASYTTGYQIFKNNILQTNSNFSLIAPSVGENAQASGLYLDKDEDNYAYYFRGNPINNYVKFGKYATDTTVTYLDSAGVSQTVTHTQGEDMIWRIVKINSDGSLKLILDDVIGTTAFNATSNDVKYTNFVYDTTTDSTIKDVLDTWYATHLETEYGDYIKENNFCMDNTSTTTNDVTYFGGYTRNVTSNNPNSICDNSSIVSSKIGLLTVDEIAKAGGLYNTTNTGSYLYKNVNGWWTMSPAKYESDIAYNFISGSNSINISDVTTEYAIRPVINIQTNLVVAGNGNNDNAYYISRFNDETNYEITIDNIVGGTITSSKIRAKAGETITISNTPTSTSCDVYEYVNSLVKNTSNSNEYATLNEGTNTFIMPRYDVTITPNWNQTQKILYNAGDQCTSNSGGWNGVAYHDGASITYNSGNITLYANSLSSGHPNGYIYTQSKIDLADYNTLYMLYSSSSGASGSLYSYVGIADTPSSWPSSPYTSKIGTQNSDTISYNISSQTGTKYVFGATYTASGWTNSVLYVFKIWLTK